MRFAPRFLAALLSFYATVLCAIEPLPEPTIGPGYSPENEVDEAGLWLEMEDYERAVRQSALLMEDPLVNDYVRGAMCRVAQDYCDDLRVYVIKNPGFNASMTPNGVVLVWTGLLTRVSSEDELAAVLGHELAHYTQLHSLARSRKIAAQLSSGAFFDLGLMLLTGVALPLGQATALANAMAFTRDQESEADLLGLRFMSEAGYDPHAAYRVWEMIVAEEDEAEVKRKKPDAFSNTHPDASKRIEVLRENAFGYYGSDSYPVRGREKHLEFLNYFYMELMESQLDTNRFGRTLAMLKRHRELGVQPQLVSYFHGEAYRQRGAEGDMEKALAAYSEATLGANPVAAAHRNLGYMYLKKGDMSGVKAHFSAYLAMDPDSDDRAMIEFYLNE